MTRFWAIWVGFGIRVSGVTDTCVSITRTRTRAHVYAHAYARYTRAGKMVTRCSQQETRPTAPDPQQQKPHELDKKAQLWYTGRMILPTQLLELAKQG